MLYNMLHTCYITCYIHVIYRGVGSMGQGGRVAPPKIKLVVRRPPPPVCMFALPNTIGSTPPQWNTSDGPDKIGYKFGVQLAIIIFILLLDHNMNGTHYQCFHFTSALVLVIFCPNTMYL